MSGAMVSILFSVIVHSWKTPRLDGGSARRRVEGRWEDGDPK